MKFDLAKIKKMKNLKDLEIYLFKTYLPKNGNQIIKAELLNLIHTYFPTVTSEQANQFITLLKDNRVVFLRGYGYVGNETLESFGCRQQDVEENEQAKVLDPPAARQKKDTICQTKRKTKNGIKTKNNIDSKNNWC
ncbi:hypothetical protein [Spiroplasma endosymbiont of Glossina fuscipes fuscipes]|uniref:hypothetical protein n=1 Tax=Spiroplasma endosymbiont of Glossina fuscipes fuscipes TaxID=2004463 RepID=UPI003C71CD44